MIETGRVPQATKTETPVYPPTEPAPVFAPFTPPPLINIPPVIVPPGEPPCDPEIDPECQPDDPEDPEDPPTDAPEPAMVFVLMTAILAFWWFRANRKA